MEHVGPQCVPAEASLIEALLAKDTQQFEALQARDGYGGSLTATSQTVALASSPGEKSARDLLRGTRLLQLTGAEITQLAAASGVIHAMPTQVIAQQGQSNWTSSSDRAAAPPSVRRTMPS